MKVAKKSGERSAASASCQNRFVTTRCTSAAAIPAASSSGTVRRIRPRRGRSRRATRMTAGVIAAQMAAATKLAARAMPHGSARRGWREGPRR